MSDHNYDSLRSTEWLPPNVESNVLFTVECKRGMQHRLQSGYMQLREGKHEGGMSKIEQKSVHK